MKRSIACLVLACVVGLALAGCSSAAKTPATPSVPTSTSGSATSPQSSNAATGAYQQGAEKGGGPATLAKYNQIATGMKYDAVVKLMGAPGKKLGEATVGSITGAMYVWYGKDPNTSAIVQFSNGAVSTKSQTGLK